MKKIILILLLTFCINTKAQIRTEAPNNVWSTLPTSMGGEKTTLKVIVIDNFYAYLNGTSENDKVDFEDDYLFLNLSFFNDSDGAGISLALLINQNKDELQYYFEGIEQTEYQVIVSLENNGSFIKIGDFKGIIDKGVFHITDPNIETLIELLDNKEESHLSIVFPLYFDDNPGTDLIIASFRTTGKSMTHYDKGNFNY